MGLKRTQGQKRNCKKGTRKQQNKRTGKRKTAKKNLRRKRQTKRRLKGGSGLDGSGLDPRGKRLWEKMEYRTTKPRMSVNNNDDTQNRYSDDTQNRFWLNPKYLKSSTRKVPKVPIISSPRASSSSGKVPIISPPRESLLPSSEENSKFPKTNNNKSVTSTSNPTNNRDLKSHLDADTVDWHEVV